MQVNATLYFTLAHMPDVEPEHVSKIMHLIRERQKIGEQKYGHSIDRDDLTREEWLQHLLEEMLDGAQYAVKANEPTFARTLLSMAAAIIEEQESI